MSGATQALDMQLDLIRFTESDMGAYALHRFLKAYANGQDNRFQDFNPDTGEITNVPLGEEVEAFRGELREQVGRGETFYVSPAMTDLVQQAAEGLAPEPIHATDLFAERAFVVFDRDIPYLFGGDQEHLSLSLRALSWSVRDTVGHRGDDGRLHNEPGLLFTAWISTRCPELVALYAENGVTDNPIAARTPLLPMEFTAWGFGVEWTEGPYDHERLDAITAEIALLDADKPDDSGEWRGQIEAIEAALTAERTEIDQTVWPQIAQLRRLVLAVNRLMWQKVAVVHDGRAPRPTIRRAGRVPGYQTPDYGVIRTIHLRREYDALDKLSAADRDELLAEGGPWWTHRWVVRGHWRNQWYPKLDDHRAIFIAPYVKGPADRPLIVKDKLFVVDR